MRYHSLAVLGFLIIMYIQVERYTGFGPYLSLIPGILSVMSGVMLLIYSGAGMAGFDNIVSDLVYRPLHFKACTHQPYPICGGEQDFGLLSFRHYYRAYSCLYDVPAAIFHPDRY